MKTETLLVATQNRHKAVEIAALLRDLPVRVITLADVDPDLDLPETGDTFAENARQKALAGATLTGLLTLADDSGLSVDALHGAPGVHSKRFAPSDGERIAKVLGLLRDVPPAQRTARFHCAVALANREGIVTEIEETVDGTLIDTPRGDQGFGYDPIFLPDGQTCTMAELDLEAKNALSHRGKAFRRAAKFLHQWFAHA